MHHEFENSDQKILEKLRCDALWLDNLEKTILKVEYQRSSILDITGLLSKELEQYNKKLKEWGENFRNCQEMLCIAGLDGYFKQLNPAFIQNFGYSEGELLARPFADFIHPDDKEKTATALRGLGTGNDAVNFENRYLDNKGNWRWINWHCPASIGGDKLYAIARDVTEIKQKGSTHSKIY